MADNCREECFSCRDIREIADTQDIGAINENFDTLRDQVQELCDKLNLYITADGLDADGKCITNVKDCCADPSSAMPRSAIEDLIKSLTPKNDCSTTEPTVTCEGTVVPETTTIPVAPKPSLAKGVLPNVS